MTQEDIVTVYKNRGSIHGAADYLGISDGVVRKVLIEQDIIVSPLIRRINELASAGMSQKQISEILRISTSCVNANIAYQRGTYLGADKTANAMRVKKCRDKKQKGDKQP